MARLKLVSSAKTRIASFLGKGKGEEERRNLGVKLFFFFGLNSLLIWAISTIGQEYKANYLKLVQFNKQKKMIKMRIYLDSHQFHTTKDHVEKGHLPSHPMSDREP